MKEELLNETNGGLLFYELVFKKRGQEVIITDCKSNKLHSLFYSDKNPSFSLYYKEVTKKWHFNDFGSSDYNGDVFDFAGHLYNLNPKSDFRELLLKMKMELKNLKDFDKLFGKDWKPSNTSNGAIVQKEFKLESIPFTEEGLAYFSEYGINETILMENNVTQWRCKQNELRFAYLGSGFAKIYKPATSNSPKEFYWLGNKPKDYAFGLEDYSTGEIVILTAGEKDVLTLKSLGYNAFCLSSENVNLPKHIAKDIYQSGAKLIVMYDIDGTGLKESEKLSNEFHIPRIILPNELKLKGGKDISDWIKLGLPVEMIHKVVFETRNSKINENKKDNQSYALSTEEGNISFENNKDGNEQNVSKTEENVIRKNELNSFPIEVFPLAIQNIINSTYKDLSFPIDYIASAIIASASVGIGNTHKIKVKEEWYESALIYIVLVGKPGINKSHPLSFATKPIQERDQSNNAQSNRERVIVTDFTPEALIKIHSENKRGIAVYVDELAGWIKNFNRYHKGNEQELWLSIWSSKQIVVDRKSSDPILIATPFISVFGTIQPSVLEKLSKNELSQNGFIDRILFVIPENVKKEHLKETDLNPKIYFDWKQIITKLLELPLNIDEEGKINSNILSFSQDAFSVYTKWHRKNTDLCNNEENETLASIYSKFDMYIARLALILQMLYWACKEEGKEEVGLKAICGAERLVEYFLKNAIKANQIITSPIEKLPTNKRKLYELLPDNFSTASGLLISKKLNIPEKTFKNFLRDTNLFEKVSHGQYEKKY